MVLLLSGVIRYGRPVCNRGSSSKRKLEYLLKLVTLKQWANNSVSHNSSSRLVVVMSW